MPIQSIMALPAFLLLLLAISTVVDASSNTVSITHRSHSTNYSNGLNVVKRDEETDDEYTTNFYKRVQDNKRRAMFGSMSSDEERQYSTRRNEDHSLDHYFDHRLPSSSQHNMKEGKSKLAAAESPDEPLSSSEGARSVRGGASSTATLPPRPAFWRRSSHHHGRSGRHDHHPEDDIPSSLRGNRHHGRSIEDFDDDEHCDPYGYTATDEMEDGEYQGDEDYADHHHHSALLRVPCKIAVNSGEASAGQRHHTDSSSQAKTDVSAYVDTGAQVTVILASAAKRAGIYHLIDRRYAGRATGVGHCRVLGRIPARHVYFILGEGCDDGHGIDCRGGEQRGYYDEDDYEYEEDESNSSRVQMDGPALTVLEGTVTPGVDVLLGLDVLQDWEAEIRMGPRKSITVKRKQRRGRNGVSGGGCGSSSVVIPFASDARRESRSDRLQQQRSRSLPGKAGGSGIAADRHHRPHSRAGHGRHAHSSPTTHHHRRHHESQPHNIDLSEFESKFEDIDEEDDDEDYSPSASNIEMELDMLDRSAHEFPDDRSNSRSMDDDIMGSRHIQKRREMDSVRDEDDEDFEEEEDSDGEDDIDMCGL